MKPMKRDEGVAAAPKAAAAAEGPPPSKAPTVQGEATAPNAAAAAAAAPSKAPAVQGEATAPNAAAAAVVAPSKAPTVQGEATAPNAAAAAVVHNDGWGRSGPPPSKAPTVERPYAVPPSKAPTAEPTVERPYVDYGALYLSRRVEHFDFGCVNKRKRFQGYSSSSEDEGSYVSKEEVDFEAMKDEDLFVIDRVGKQ
jgi:hypothetical protein